MLSALAICRLACSLCISAIAFLIAAVHYATVEDSASNLTIQGYMLNTSSVGTNPLGPAVLLIALNAICNAMSLLILGILIVII